MFHFQEALIPKTGLAGYFCKVIDPATNAVVPIYADNNGTPIISASTIANMCKADDAGNFDFYVAPGTYNIDLYGTDGTTFIKRLTNVRMDDGSATLAAAAAASAAAQGYALSAQGYSTSAQGYSVSAASSAAGVALAAAIANAYPNAAASYVPKGLTQAGVGSITGGSGGTNGTFALGFSGGNFIANPTGTFTVSGGALTAVNITGAGLYIGASPSVPTPSFAASSGLTGASVVLTAQLLIASGGGYWVQSSDGLLIYPFTNVSGTATATSGVNPIPTNSIGTVGPTRLQAVGSTDAAAPKVTEYVSTTGKRKVADAYVKRLNGIRPRSGGFLMRPYVSALLSTAMFIPVEGQSLAQETQGGGPLIPSLVGRSKGWRYATNNPSYTTDLLDAISGSSVTDGPDPQGNPRDFPGLAIGPHFAEMLLRDHNIATTDSNFTTITACNALGSQAISQFIKGATYYQRTVSQVQPTKDYGTANGQPVLCPGVVFCQGEADQTGTFASYKSSLQTKATNQAADIRAILLSTDAVSADQTFDPMLFCSTTCSGTGGTARFPVTRATLDAAIDYYLGNSTAPVVHTTPLYHLPYLYDVTGVHCESSGTYLIGAYAAQAIKRVLMDEDTASLPINQRFPPMFIKSIRRIGTKSVLLKIQMRNKSAKLEWGVSPMADGYGIAQQTNYGWAIYDPGTSANLSISTPVITAPDEILLTLSSGSLSNGMLVNYGLTQLVRKNGYFGGASGHEKGAGGNMRDNFGDYAFSEVVGCPMHNWMSPQGIVLDASAAGFARYTTQTI